MFWALGSTERPPSQMLIDSTAVKAHLCAGEAKGGSKASPSVAYGAGSRRRSTPSPPAFAPPRSPSC